MRLFRSFLLVLSLAPAIMAGDLTFPVSVNLIATEKFKDSIYTEITQSLRRIPDIRIVTSGQKYAVNVVCLQSGDNPILSCSLAITLTTHYDSWQDWVKPSNVSSWNLLLAGINSTHELVFHQVYSIGTHSFEWFGKDIADTLNSQFLEGLRQFNEGNRATAKQ